MLLNWLEVKHACTRLDTNKLKQPYLLPKYDILITYFNLLDVPMNVDSKYGISHFVFQRVAGRNV